MAKKLNVLLVEDNPGDAFLMEEMLDDIPDYQFEIVNTGTLDETISNLKQTKFDIVLLDLGLPDSEGLSGLEAVLNLGIDFPVVVITGLNDNKTGQKAVEMGAQSYMIKGKFDSYNIVQTILYSIDRNTILKSLRKREAELNKTNKELTEANSAKNLMISVISHDLRGPLTSIISLLEIFYSDFDNIDKETKKKYLKTMLSSVKNSHNLMENLLNWAQFQSNRQKVEPEKIEVGELIREGTNPLYQMASEKGIELKLRISGQRKVYADKSMITTVIRNLVSNAIKFTNRNGEIRVSSNGTKTGDVNISVEDNGVGIREEVLTTLFELHKTSSTRGTDDEAGSGFGLILCKEFVEKNNGKMEIESKRGDGTRVNITLPASSS